MLSTNNNNRVCAVSSVAPRESDRSNRFSCLFPKFSVWLFYFHFPHFFLGRLFPNRRRLDRELYSPCFVHSRVSRFFLFKQKTKCTGKVQKFVFWSRETKQETLCRCRHRAATCRRRNFRVFFVLKRFHLFFDSCLKERERVETLSVKVPVIFGII
jgi:hypothetical protein